MLYTLFLPVKNFLNKKRKTVTDTKVFRLHTITTPALFISLSIFYGFKEFVGEPIYCLGPTTYGADSRIAFVNDYCWVSSTYSVEDYFSTKYNNRVPYPGVGQVYEWSTVIFHKFYMWIPFFFVFLSCLFYTPRYIWKYFESGHMKMLVEKLDTPIIEEEVKRTRITLLTNYVHATLGFNNSYALIFFACEVWNFFVAIFSFYATDLLINHKFATYGPDVVRYWRESGRKSPNPMTTVFPKLTKCTVNFYGATSNIQPLDYICTMSINNFNDKIFFILWFYFIILVSISVLAIIFRVVVIFSPKLRILMLRKSLIKLKLNCAADKLSNLMVGDWFVIHQLGKNIDKLAYFDFLDMLAKKLEPDKEILDVTV